MANNRYENMMFCNSLADCVFFRPYAILRASEVEPIVKRFVSWLHMLETHPDLVEKLGEGKGAHVNLIRALPTAIETAKQAGIFPKVILLETEFQASLDLYAAQDAAVNSLPEIEF